MAQHTPEDLLSTLKDISTCMFTTVDSTGRLVSRPMAVSHIDQEHRLWFFTSASSEKISDILGEGHVNLSFVADKTWVSVAGSAEVITDQQKKAELEDLGAEAYFSDGAEDTEAVLLSVTPDTAQYWEGPGKAAALVKLVKSSLSSQDSPDMGDHGRVDL
ncbi:pyridoxamine 5'-phosphate oxidase family protein [Nesterenkonia massiliensis]|uniref:Pyridoxamine 5'-phosphate oxidase family protein n=1 Tax=Nesterenkonia massiliensis TaxID=1232429 RepID=A0ABT2HMK3_9MICC|nr:pyridoxamine 5'-phosphate oxidase family protein [Nesterenkonia massiliensis]MCT1605909.1 pyridoxamine 5'-phosphate oxidase family protein [Nesterenkonia massiliensis]